MTSTLSPQEQIHKLAEEYVATGSVPDYDAGVTKARAIMAAAEILGEALIRIETERLIAEASQERAM